MLTRLKDIYSKLGYNLPLLIAFFLPFGINYAIFIMIWALCFFLLDDVKLGFKSIFSNKWSFALLGFFILHVLGAFYAKQSSEISSTIEIKLVFLAFPILIFASRYNDIQLKKIMVSFVSGCILASLLCIFRALFLYFFQNTNAFLYSDFAFLIHPSYMAMYLVFAQLIVLLYYPKWLSHLKALPIKIGFISFIFLLTIFLCSSKMGIITALVLLPLTFIIKLYNNGHKKIIMWFVLSFIAICTISYQLFPVQVGRFKTAFKVTSSTQTIDKSDAESTAVRILVWKESIKIIKNNFWIGTSPADANEALYQSYQADGLTGAYSKKLNAHNQFFQTFIGTGIIGFILLLSITVFIIFYGLLKKEWLLTLFGVLITLNFLVESMLQAQAGFTFFVFFLCILLQYDLSKISNKAT